MTFRGYFALNGVEFANSSRVSAHLGKTTPTMDSQVFGPAAGCEPPLVSEGLAAIPGDTSEVRDGLYTPPGGAQRVSPGLATVEDCWPVSPLCGCHISVEVDDSWPGLQEFLDHQAYRPELAPWHNLDYPESSEFGGVWVTSVTGLDVTPVTRTIMEMAGNGASAGISRDTSRTVTFEAVLVACTSAGLQYGLSWLSCQLRAATDDDGATLDFLAAHPGESVVDPYSLWRESRSVMLTKAPEITTASGGGPNRQANIYRVTWEMVACSPYVYRPALTLPVDWDTVTVQPVNWLHDTDCDRPDSCSDMPVLFSTDCVPELIPEVTSPPPVCGGCLPISGVESFTFHIPTLSAPERCRESAVSVTVTNTGTEPLSLQGHFQPSTADTRCEDTWFPLQVSGLPPEASLHLDGTSGRFHAVAGGLKRRPIGVVGTPTGAPWRPATITRYEPWDFVVQAAPNTTFSIELTLHDREP